MVLCEMLQVEVWNNDGYTHLHLTGARHWSVGSAVIFMLAALVSF